MVDKKNSGAPECRVLLKLNSPGPGLVNPRHHAVKARKIAEIAVALSKKSLL